VRVRILAAAAAGCVLAAAGTASGRDGAAASCAPSAVTYRSAPGAHGIGFQGGTPPWVSHDGVVGFLFYYGAGPFRSMHSARAYVTLDGRVGTNASTKVLWWFKRTARVGATARIVGTRLDAPGSFTDTSATQVAGPSFPSYLVVPAPGCRHVTVSSGRANATFVFGAFRER